MPTRFTSRRFENELVFMRVFFCAFLLNEHFSFKGVLFGVRRFIRSRFGSLFFVRRVNLPGFFLDRFFQSSFVNS